MSSTNKTTNYELSQFIETDKPGWLTDYNGDMRTIDSNMKAISDVANGASGSVSSLDDRMTVAEGAITTNENDIDALEARADALEAQAQSTAGTIAGIQTEQITQNAGIEAATELGYNLARPYDSASTYAVGAYVLFQNTLYKCITAISTGEAFDPTKWLAIKATDEIAAEGYTLPIASASQLGGVKIGDGLSIDPVTGVLNASKFKKVTFTGTSDNHIFTRNNVYPSTLYYHSFSGGADSSVAVNISLISNERISIIYNDSIAFVSYMLTVNLDSATQLGNSAATVSFNNSFNLNTNYSGYNDLMAILNRVIATQQPYSANLKSCFTFAYSPTNNYFTSMYRDIVVPTGSTTIFGGAELDGFEVWQLQNA